MPITDQDIMARWLAFQKDYQSDPFFQKKVAPALPTREMPDPQPILENPNRIPVDLAPHEKLPLVKGVKAIGALGGLPMPSSIYKAYQDAQNPNMSWQKRLVNFLGGYAGLDTNNPNMI